MPPAARAPTVQRELQKELQPAALPLRRLPEVLAPAGDADSMRAAALAGADAVYFGLVGTSARARAKNFDPSDLPETMRFLHGRGVRGYVALNTLMFDSELARLEDQVRACAASAVDAVIVQDLGAAQLVRAIAPGMRIHASTQMTCTDAASVILARDSGADRVILARELSLEDIAAIVGATDVELEVFVHGALCIAYSGQCLTSEAIGGRSANRGACAQACRLPYELVVDDVVRDLGDRAYLLSPQDLEASALVPELARLGVVSLKIEGRLKGPEYVAATTTLYRRAVDAVAGRSGPTEEERATALQMYTRGSGPGFLGGVDHQRLVDGRTCDHRGLLAGTSRGVRTVRGKRCVALHTATPIARGDGLLVQGTPEVGGRVWGVFDGGVDVELAAAGREVCVWLGPDRSVEAADRTGARVWKTSDPARERHAVAPLRSPHRVRLDVRVHGAIGELPVFEAVTERGARVTVRGEAPVEQARTTSTTAQALREKLGRLGETPFVLGSLEIDLPEGVMLPHSTLNRARRAMTEALATGMAPHATTERGHADLLAAARAPDRAPPPGGLFVLCRTLEQAEAALDAGADGVYLDFLELVGTGAAVRALRARPAPVHIALAAPRIRKPGEEKIDRYLAQLAPDALLVRSLGSLHDSAAGEAPRIADFSLNVTNRLSAAAVLARGVAAFTPSFDLDADQLTALLDRTMSPFAEVVVHHPMPLFHMEHCVIAALLSGGRDHKTCGRPCERHAVSLRDRSGAVHPVEADVGCRNTVFHGAAQSAASLVPALAAGGVRRFRIELVRQTGADVSVLVGAYRALVAGSRTPSDVWRDLRAMGPGAGSADGYGVVRGSLRVIQ
jgi:putative protease